MDHRTTTASNVDINIIPLRPEHAAACEDIARRLPAWFGIEEGLEDLRHCAEYQPGHLARATDQETPVGFVTLKEHFAHAREISWMAVHPDWHRHGVGRRLIDATVASCQERGVRFLLVKTLAASHPSPEYAQTRAFYEAVGFQAIEVLPDLWGEQNPCLNLIRCL